MLGYLSADNICSEKATVFPERSSRKSVSSEHIFEAKWRLPCLLPFIYFVQCTFGEYHWIASMLMCRGLCCAKRVIEVKSLFPKRSLSPHITASEYVHKVFSILCFDFHIVTLYDIIST